MNRRLQIAMLGTALMTAAACFELTEVVPTDRPEPRDSRVSVDAFIVRNEPAQIGILFDPGTTDSGQSKSLPDDSVVIAGVKYPPRDIGENGYRYYQITGISVPDGAVAVLLPLVAGLNERPVLRLPLLRIDAPDTLIAQRGGAFEVRLLGGRTTDEPTGSWSALIRTTSGEAVVALSAPGVPAALRIPTQILPSHITMGSVELSLASSYLETNLPYQTQVYLRFSGILPFKVLDP
jgi:hypothetical protein